MNHYNNKFYYFFIFNNHYIISFMNHYIIKFIEFFIMENIVSKSIKLSQYQKMTKNVLTNFKMRNEIYCFKID